MIQKKYTTKTIGIATKIVGIIMLCINVFLLCLTFYQIYLQSQTGIFMRRLPSLGLLALFLLAIIGIVISIRLLRNKISTLQAVLLQLLVIILTYAVWLVSLFFS